MGDKKYKHLLTQNALFQNLHAALRLVFVYYR